MAFIFGSFVRGLNTESSDIDIAVYLKNYGRELKIEKESDIYFDLVKILKTDNLDLVVLNYANPTLAYNILQNSYPLVIKDKGLYLDFYLKVSNEAEDFLNFMEHYLKIKLLSKSITKEAKSRLILRIDYLLTYLQEKKKFLKIDINTYKNNPDQKRNLERWTENIINATIDISKIILASEKKQMPKSYKEALFDFGLFFGLNEEDTKKFSSIADLRNILAHEYLDILYERIRDFLINILPIYERLLNFLEKYLEK